MFQSCTHTHTHANTHKNTRMKWSFILQLMTQRLAGMKDISYPPAPCFLILGNVRLMAYINIQNCLHSSIGCIMILYNFNTDVVVIILPKLIFYFSITFCNCLLMTKLYIIICIFMF